MRQFTSAREREPLKFLPVDFLQCQKAVFRVIDAGELADPRATDKWRTGVVSAAFGSFGFSGRADDSKRAMIRKDGGSPGRIRTSDMTVNSRPLYRLSYRGVFLCFLVSLLCERPELLLLSA